MDRNQILNEGGGNKNIVKKKIIGKMGGTSGGDMDEITITNANMGRKMLGRRGMRLYQRQMSCDWRHQCQNATLVEAAAEE
jgi:hypothetical protein